MVQLVLTGLEDPSTTKSVIGTTSSLVAIGVPIVVVGGALAADLVVSARRGNALLVRGWWLNLIMIVVAGVGAWVFTHQRAVVFATVMLVGFGVGRETQRKRGQRG